MGPVLRYAIFLNLSHKKSDYLFQILMSVLLVMEGVSTTVQTLLAVVVVLVSLATSWMVIQIA